MDIMDKIEEKRKKVDEDRKKRRFGTLSGLADLIARRKREVESYADFDSQPSNKESR